MSCWWSPVERKLPVLFHFSYSEAFHEESCYLSSFYILLPVIFESIKLHDHDGVDVTDGDGERKSLTLFLWSEYFLSSRIFVNLDGIFEWKIKKQPMKETTFFQCECDKNSTKNLLKNGLWAKIQINMMVQNSVPNCRRKTKRLRCFSLINL